MTRVMINAIANTVEYVVDAEVKRVYNEIVDFIDSKKSPVEFILPAVATYLVSLSQSLGMTREQFMQSIENNWRILHDNPK